MPAGEALGREKTVGGENGEKGKKEYSGVEYRKMNKTREDCEIRK